MIPDLSQSLSRRSALSAFGIALGAGGLGAFAANAPKRILLRSSWQTVNIGDIAHTPGVLHILEEYLPDAEITLWPSVIDNGVDVLLTTRFPKLKIAKSADELKAAFADCEFLLHGSGPSLVAERDVRRWIEATGKPYGVYGITLPKKSSSSTKATPDGVFQKTIAVLSGARFVFFRDSHSLALAKAEGCSSPVMEFGPDGAFACDLTDDERAVQFLKANGLEEGKFLCCIPRLRYTPYWLVKDQPKDEIKDAHNEAMRAHDHNPHLEAIKRVVAETDLKILLCPEDRTQMQVGKDNLYDLLPEETKKRVIWRPDYWLTGEAVSVYVRSAGLFGNEMHSPIMCIGHGIPAIVCRWAEQTSKGYMWEDIGLSEWLFDFDQEADVVRLPEVVVEMAKDPAGARAKAEKARAFVEKRQKETMAVLAATLK
ncbi:MAG: polysaccharide pyruvyl transferase family protein [Verrucomicrobiales bacterium]|nr:polysaccharide pyruvyl transferase family protein [Verrucomicrobiales bacterium]HQZ29005.1 polysaccharide pyruvyl transferase family protein [Verrucomicrobiales bacterium]